MFETLRAIPCNNPTTVLSAHSETMSDCWLATKAEPVKAAAAPATKAFDVDDDLNTFLNIFSDYHLFLKLEQHYCRSVIKKTACNNLKSSGGIKPVYFF
jgi:hypothetical protein